MPENLHSITLIRFFLGVKVITYVLVFIIVVIIIFFFIFVVVVLLIASFDPRHKLAPDRRSRCSSVGTFTAPELHVRIVFIRVQ